MKILENGNYTQEFRLKFFSSQIFSFPIRGKERNKKIPDDKHPSRESIDYFLQFTYRRVL